MELRECEGGDGLVGLDIADHDRPDLVRRPSGVEVPDGRGGGRASTLSEKLQKLALRRWPILDNMLVLRNARPIPSDPETSTNDRFQRADRMP